MKYRLFLFLLFCSLATPVLAMPEGVSVALINNNGDNIGQVAVMPATNGVLIRILANNLPNGLLGMHFHAVGDCSDLEGFTTAGPHIMPEGKPHGFLHPEGPHAGNLPNLFVGSNGLATVELYSNLVTYDSGPAALLDDDGSALIIHENEDDHLTQPIGGAGGRIGCAALLPVSQPPLVEKEE